MLTELGLYKLWREDPERAQIFARVWLPTVIRLLAPSYAYGLDRMPATGGLVVAVNHFSTLDPAFVGHFSKRALYFMAKVELLEVPLAGEILRWIGSFAVRRGEGDRDSIRVARWLIQEGHVVGMFMEGTRQRFGYPGPGHPGAAMLAIREGVPVVPCGIDTFRWSLRNPRPCSIVWGDPIDLGGLGANARGYREGAEIIGAEILRLWRQAAEAVMNGFPAGLPDGTPRERAPRFWEAVPVRGARPWPAESWAEVPLGPVWPGRRA